MIKYINWHCELYTGQEVTFGFLCNLPRLQGMSEETLTCHLINLYLKLNSDRHHETLVYEEIMLLRIIVPQESSVLEVPRFIFQNYLSEFI